MADVADDEGDDGFFRVPKTSSSNAKARPRRVYVGGLPKEEEEDDDGAPTTALGDDLADWMRSIVPGLAVASVSIVGGGSGGKKFPHALVDCGDSADRAAISKLHQQIFRGRKLTVQRERRNKNNNNKHNNNGNSNNNNNNDDGKKPTKGNQKQLHFGGWSKPQQQRQQQQQPPPPRPFRPMTVEEASDGIGAVVAEEIRIAEADGGDAVVDVAIASTAAAATFLAAMNGIVVDRADPGLEGGTRDEEDGDDPAGNGGDGRSSGGGAAAGDDDGDAAAAGGGGFRLKAMPDLLAEFGRADPNWRKRRADGGSAPAGSSSDSRLAPKGKAPIHVVLSSFGFRSGAPKRPEGWSHSRPLAPVDCRDRFKPVPKHMEWRTGLSGDVKRVLRQENEGIQEHAREVLAGRVWDCLLEAQDDGKHGYASPLTMTIHVGSETGRHRSVVLCEWAATGVRKKLRANEGGRVRQPVSVETHHRDVEPYRDHHSGSGKPTKKKHGFAGDW